MKLLMVALVLLTTSFAFARQEQTARPIVVSFFDVLEIPARIDQPQLEKASSGYLLKCSIANRSSEEILGLRLTLMFADASAHGHYSHLTWNEPADVMGHSIKTLELHPPIKSELHAGAIFLGADEVIGRENIWHVVNADNLLTAYASGHHGLIPKVQTVANKFDPPERAITIIPREEQQ